MKLNEFELSKILLTIMVQNLQNCG